jgi:hypothetical protein
VEAEVEEGKAKPSPPEHEEQPVLRRPERRRKPPEHDRTRAAYAPGRAVGAAEGGNEMALPLTPRSRIEREPAGTQVMHETAARGMTARTRQRGEVERDGAPSFNSLRRGAQGAVAARGSGIAEPIAEPSVAPTAPARSSPAEESITVREAPGGHSVPDPSRADVGGSSYSGRLPRLGQDAAHIEHDFPVLFPLHFPLLSPTASSTSEGWPGIADRSQWPDLPAPVWEEMGAGEEGAAAWEREEAMRLELEQRAMRGMRGS